MTINVFPRPWRQVVVASPQPSIANRPLWRRMPSCVPGHGFVCRVRDFGFCVIACLFGVKFVIAPLGTCWPTTNLKQRSRNKLYVGTSLVHCKLQLWYQFELAFFVPVTTLAMKTLHSTTRELCFQASMADLSGSYYELLAPIVLNTGISKDWGVASHLQPGSKR